MTREKQLLSDLDWCYLHHPDQNNGIEVPNDGIRIAEYRMLQFCGFAVSKPEIRESIDDSCN